MRRCLSLLPFVKYKLGKQALERRDRVALSANIFKNEFRLRESITSLRTTDNESLTRLESDVSNDDHGRRQAGGGGGLTLLFHFAVPG